MRGSRETVRANASESFAIAGLDVRKAKRYSKVRLATLAGSAIISAGELAWFAFSGQSRGLRDLCRQRLNSRAAATAGYAAVGIAGSWCVSLPWSFVAGHLVERRFGLTRQSPAGWLGDRLKGLGLSVALETPLVVAGYTVIRRRPRDWWLVLSGAAIPFAVVMSNLAPVLIMPLFNRFEPVGDDALERRIRNLAERAGVTIAEVFRMDMSRQTEKANAFFTGLGGTKRIVLGDTMLDRSSIEEIEAVVAHELGHQVHGDIWRLIAFSSASLLGLAFGVSRVAPWAIAKTSSWTGVQEIGDEAGTPVLGLVAGLLGAIITPLHGAFSRSIERRTDRYALWLTGNGAAYAAAMERLAAQNLADPSPSRLMVLLLYSHPPIAERIKMARAYEQAPPHWPEGA